MLVGAVLTPTPSDTVLFTPNSSVCGLDGSGSARLSPETFAIELFEPSFGENNPDFHALLLACNATGCSDCAAFALDLDLRRDMLEREAVKLDREARRLTLTQPLLLLLLK